MFSAWLSCQFAHGSLQQELLRPRSGLALAGLVLATWTVGESVSWQQLRSGREFVRSQRKPESTFVECYFSALFTYSSLILADSKR